MDDMEPHTVCLTFQEQDFCVFPSAGDHGPTVYVEEMNGDDEHVLVGVPAPALPIDRSVFWEPLDAVFGALRVPDVLGEFLEEGTELCIAFPDLDLALREDNVYARDISLHDISQLALGFECHGSLRMVVTEDTRFISRYNELATALGSEESEEDVDVDADNVAPGQEADDAVPRKEADDTVPSEGADEEVPRKEADDAMPSEGVDEEVSSEGADEEVPGQEADDAVPSKEADEEVPRQEADTAVPSEEVDEEVPREEAGTAAHVSGERTNDTMPALDDEADHGAQDTQAEDAQDADPGTKVAKDIVQMRDEDAGTGQADYDEPVDGEVAPATDVVLGKEANDSEKVIETADDTSTAAYEQADIATYEDEPLKRGAEPSLLSSPKRPKTS